MRFDPIAEVMLFGGASLVVPTVDALRARGVRATVYTSPRHAAESLDAEGRTLASALQQRNQAFVVTEDINATDLPIGPTTLGIRMREAWGFSPAIIQRFGGRLLDFMGIAHLRYRGGAYYPWMILHDERLMDMNLQIIKAEMVGSEHDSGAIVKCGTWRLPDAARTPQDIFDAAVVHETAFIAEFLDEVRAGRDFESRAPDESRSLFLPRLRTVVHGWIDWGWNGADIERFIRAFDDPYPGARTLLDGKVVSLKGARLRDDEGPFHPFQSGLVTRVTSSGVCVATTAGHLHIARVLDARPKPGQRFFTPQATLEIARTTRVTYSTSLASAAPPQEKRIAPSECFDGERVTLRLVTLADCTPRYVGWLEDPEVKRYLETRFAVQTLEAVRAFVHAMIDDEKSYLFAILDKADAVHVGNIKIGPIHAQHSYADVSYFIGERKRWGRGLASDAIAVATRIGFERLGLHRLQAGVYEGNVGSIKALLRVGYRHEGTSQKQRNAEGRWEDLLSYGLLREEWRP